ncbi:retrovirus-related pol polyprotein from transposon TNT 1-94, partial [Tanacetum coccineum]
VKFLRSKDETPAFVINLLKHLQVGLNKTVRFVRTDNGTEFVNKVRINGVVELRNRTLVEAARTMLIFSKAPLFLWAEAVATACYTQNRSLIHTLHDKTPYKLVHDKKPDLCRLRTKQEGLPNLQQTNPTNHGNYSRTFDELTGQTAPVHSSLRPAPNLLTSGPISSGLVPNPPPATPYVPPTNKELKILFQPMFDEYFVRVL